MALPIILWRNIFRTTGAVITSGGTDTGYSPDNVKDHRANIGWQGNVLTSPQYVNVDCLAAVTADSILVINHNMVANGGQIKVYADTVNPPVAVAQAAYTPTSDVADFKAFSSLTKRYWRVEFIDPAPPFATKPFVGEILLGVQMTMPEYVAPDVPPRPHEIVAFDDKSAGGHFLGVTYQGIARRGTLKFGGDAGVDRAFFTSDMTSFLETHFRKLLPWGFVLDSADSEFSTARWYKKPADATSPTLPVGNNYSRFRCDLAFEEAMMEQVP